MIDFQTLVPAAVAITTIGGAWLTVRKIARDIKKARKERDDEILRKARAADELIKTELEAKIAAVKAQLDNLENSISKDFIHLKETYTNELKNLGEKIESLREELHSQHGQLVSLLTEMVKKRH